MTFEEWRAARLGGPSRGYRSPLSQQSVPGGPMRRPRPTGGQTARAEAGPMVAMGPEGDFGMGGFEGSTGGYGRGLDGSTGVYTRNGPDGGLGGYYRDGFPLLPSPIPVPGGSEGSLGGYYRDGPMEPSPIPVPGPDREGSLGGYYRESPMRPGVRSLASFVRR